MVSGYKTHEFYRLDYQLHLLFVFAVIVLIVNKDYQILLAVDCFPHHRTGVAGGCTGRTCTPQGENKFLGDEFRGVGCKCTPGKNEKSNFLRKFLLGGGGLEGERRFNLGG